MKKLLACLCAGLVLLVAGAGCGDKDDNKKPVENPDPNVKPEADVPTPPPIPQGPPPGAPSK